MIGVCRVHARTDVGAHIAAELAPLVGPDIECVLCAQERRDAEEEAAATFHHQLRLLVAGVVLATVETLVLGWLYSHTRHDNASPYGVAFLTVLLQALVGGLGGIMLWGAETTYDATEPGSRWTRFFCRVFASCCLAAVVVGPLLGLHG